MEIALVLSGGGARGMAHLGVLKALDELGIKPTIISGVSAGAIAGAFYASGYSPDEILEIAFEKNVLNFSHLLWRRAGFFKMPDVRYIYQKYLKKNSFEELNIPLIIAATDIVHGRVVYFSSGELIEPIIASSSIPVVFEPIQYKDNLLLDGGILNNLPIEPVLKEGRKIIGVHVNPIRTKLDKISMKTVLDRSFHLTMRNAIINKISMCDVFIEPQELSKYGLFDLSRAKARKIFDIGYQYTLGMKEKLEKLIA